MILTQKGQQSRINLTNANNFGYIMTWATATINSERVGPSIHHRRGVGGAPGGDLSNGQTIFANDTKIDNGH